MKNTAWSIAACLILLSSSGCAVSPLRSFEERLEEAGIAKFTRTGQTLAPGRSVVVTGEWQDRTGRGAVISSRHVLTVAHVVGAETVAWVGTSRRKGGRAGWVKARVLKRIAASPEPLVVLELDVDDGLFGALLGFTGFSAADCYDHGRGSPQAVALGRGLHPWAPGVLSPGDSGAPVLDRNGNLLGLVTGRRGSRGVYTPIPSRQPSTLAARRLAPRRG
jgi:S1-C subfamily serine protease